MPPTSVLGLFQLRSWINQHPSAELFPFRAGMFRLKWGTYFYPVRSPEHPQRADKIKREAGKIRYNTGSKSELEIKQVYPSFAFQPKLWRSRADFFDSCDSFLIKQGGCGLRGCFGSPGVGKAPGSAVTTMLIHLPPHQPYKKNCSCRDVALSILCQAGLDAQKTSGYSRLSQSKLGNKKTQGKQA